LANKVISWYNSLLGKEVKVEQEYKPYNGPEVRVMAQAPVVRMWFDGEKTLGEIGIIRDWQMDTKALAYRSWQSFTENDITQDVIKKFILWVCGGGLKLQSEPLTNILKELISNFDHENFTNTVEARFALFAKSQKTSWSGEQSLNVLCQEAYKNALIGCDCLVVLRVKNGKLTVQLIDTNQLGTPYNLVLDQNRKVVDGVEIGDRGQIIGFHVKKPNTLGEYEFIKARDSKGRKMAYLVYATKMRIDDVRGVPIITPVLETLKMLDRYKNATVGGAEERQKIALFIEHDKDSTGENPLLDNVKRSLNTTGNNDKHTQDYLQEIQEIQGQIAITQQKQAINLTNGSTIKSIQSDQEINFKDFFLTNVNIICACIGIPPEIALSKYDSNFSASRAAIKDWEHTLNVVRKNFSEQFYQPIYELWLDLMILQGKIDEKNYFNALMNEDDDILGAFRNCRWTGASVPHIDPLKEVQAERLKLGDLGANIPLTTAEKATENVNGGESNSNIEQFLKEIAKIPNPEPKNVANNEK